MDNFRVVRPYSEYAENEAYSLAKQNSVSRSAPWYNNRMNPYENFGAFGAMDGMQQQQQQLVGVQQQQQLVTEGGGSGGGRKGGGAGLGQGRYGMQRYLMRQKNIRRQHTQYPVILY
jgi:hypothetical protein